MNPAIYMGTQAKYRFAIKILFFGNKVVRRNSKSIPSEPGQQYGGAKFYVRQISSSTDTPTDQIDGQQDTDPKGRLSGMKLKRQVSFQ